MGQPPQKHVRWFVVAGGSPGGRKGPGVQEPVLSDLPSGGVEGLYSDPPPGNTT